MLSTTSQQQSHLFSSYRALGLVTNHVPCILRIHQRHSSHLLLTAIGKVFHAYRLNTLQVLLVSDPHPEDIQVLASNSRLVFAAAGSSVYIYRRVFHLYKTLTEHQGDVQHLLPFGDDHLITIDQANTLRVWDIESATVYLSLEFDIKNFHITCLLHPATYVNKLLLASRQGTMQLWNIKSNKLLHEFFSQLPSTNSITTIAQSTVVDVVAIGYNNGQIRLHNLRYDETLVTFTQDFNGPITSIAFRLDNIPHMATGSSTGHICIWNLDTCHLISQVREAHKDCSIATLHYVPGEPLLISNGNDNAVREWIFDMPDGQSCRLYRERCGHSKPPRCVRYHDNEIILSAGNDGRLRTFHTILDNLSRCFGRTTRYNWEAELDEDENNEEITNETNRQQAMPIIDLRCEVIKENDWDGIVAIHEKRRRISAWNYIRATRSQHRFEHERFATKVYHNIEVYATCCDISPCGNFCAIGYSTGHIDMFNMQSGLYRGSFDDSPMKFSTKNPGKRIKSSPYATAHSTSLCGISFDSLNTRLISSDINGNIKLWRLKTKTLISSTTILNQDNPNIQIIKMITHRDSGLIAFAFNNQTIKIYDFDTLTFKCIRTFNENTHTKEITALAFMPDGRWLFSTSLDKTMRIWDIPSGQLIDTLEFDQAIVTLAVSPNGDMLATGHTDALGVYLWSNRSMYGGSRTSSISESDKEQLLVGEFQSPEQISKSLITLSSLPESKWKNLLVLDTIRQRNKPKEPVHVPKQAPFFLPTVSNLRGFVFINPDDETEKNSKDKKSSHINQIQQFLYESPLTNLLDQYKENSSIALDVVQLLKDFGMAKIEYELRCLSSEQGGSIERMIKFLDIINDSFDNKQNYDLISSYFALFIQLHGTNVLCKNEQLIDKIQKIQNKQKETWNNLQRQLNTSIALVKYIKSVTTI